MEVVTFSETSVPRYRATLQHEPEHETLLTQNSNLWLDAQPGRWWQPTTSSQPIHGRQRQTSFLWRTVHILKKCCISASSRHFDTHSIHRTRIHQTHHHQSEDGLFRRRNTYGGCFLGFNIKCTLCLTGTYWFYVLLHFRHHLSLLDTQKH